MKHYIRLFVAAPLPSGLVEALAEFAGVYEQPGVRIIPQGNWHLTFYFIGNVPVTKLPEISSRLKAILSGFEAFNLKLLRVAPGPNARSPRLVWAMFSENKTFKKLVRALTIGLGAKVENPNPIPHITLARLAKDPPKPVKLPVVPAATPVNFQVNEIALWQSELGSPHPKYTVAELFKAATGNNGSPEK